MWTRMRKAVKVAEIALLIAFVMVALILSAIYAKPVQAQSSVVDVFNQNLIDNGDVTPRLYVEWYTYKGENWGLWGSAYGEKQYASTVAGLFYDILTIGDDFVIDVGVALGAETFPDEEGTYNYHPRLAGQIGGTGEKFTFQIYYEDWPNGDSWLRIQGDYMVNQYVALGAIHQTNDGTGPRITLFVPNTPFRVWGGPLFGEGNNYMVNFQYIRQW